MPEYITDDTSILYDDSGWEDSNEENSDNEISDEENAN